MNTNAYRKKGDIVARRIGDELLLVPIRGKLADMQRLVVLEGVGDFLWEKLDGTVTVEYLRDALSAEFDVMPEQAAKDVEEFLSALEAVDILTKVA